MVERAILTKRIVDETDAPSQGERWISDTIQKGFGLRIWRSNSGEARKAYCVRALDGSGKSVRRTLPYWQASHIFRQEHWWSLEGPSYPSVGELVHVARRWAHDELARLKGRPTLSEEDEAQKNVGKRRAAALTLVQASEVVLGGMMHAGLTNAYRDRLLKLFSSHVPSHIANKRAIDVTLNDIAKVFRSQSLKPGNLRILRPFIGQVLDIPRRFGAKTATSSYDFRDIGQPRQPGSASVAKLHSWREPDYDSFFALFETEQDKWQQARCLRLFFHFYCPMSQLMRARWDQLWIVNSGRGSGEGEEPRKFLQWRYTDKWRGFETLRGASEQIARECLKRCQTEFPKSEFWFPTRFGRQVGHIRSIDHLWRTALAEHKLGYVSPRVFRAAYRKVQPWHGWWPEFMATLSTKSDGRDSEIE